MNLKSRNDKAFYLNDKEEMVKPFLSYFLEMFFAVFKIDGEKKDSKIKGFDIEIQILQFIKEHKYIVKNIADSKL